MERDLEDVCNKLSQVQPILDGHSLHMHSFDLGILYSH